MYPYTNSATMTVEVHLYLVQYVQVYSWASEGGQGGA